MYRQSYSMKCALWLLAAAMLLGLGGELKAEQTRSVEATGFAPGAASDPRGEALANALREAIRKGTKIDIATSTSVKNFVLDYDEILTRSFGYIRDYEVTHSGRNEDGDYVVSIRAEVGEGDPGLNDEMAIKMLLKRKKSPKVSIEIDENIRGIEGETNFAESWLVETCRDLGLAVVSESRIGRQQRRMAGKDALFGDDLKANIREANLSVRQDYILHARIIGDYAGAHSYYGSEPMHEFDLQVELSVLRPDTGETLVSVTLPPNMFNNSSKRTSRMAAAEVVRKTLEGSDDPSVASGYDLFHKLMAQWVTELDLGMLVTCEFYQFNNSDRLDLIRALEKTRGVSAVLPGEFDARAFTYIDVETRLDVDELAQRIEKELHKDYLLQVRNTHSLRFVPADQMP